MKLRIQGRSASGTARYASYQRIPYGSSASRSGSRGTACPARGRQSFICWSGRSSISPGSSSAVKPILAVRGVTRSMSTTRTYVTGSA